MLFHCILTNERPSLSNLPLMLFLDPYANFLNNTMITSVWFPCLQYWSHPEAPLIFPVFLSGDAVLIQQAKGFKTQCFMIRHQRRIPFSDNVSLSRSGKCLCLVEANFSCCTSNQTHYPDLGNDASSVWIFCAPFLHVISQENQLWRHEMSAVFSGY